MNKRLLIISPDTIGANMGGVGMRYWELAHQLAGIAQVTLAAPGKPAPKSSGLDTRSYVVGRSDTLAPLAEMADVILLSGFTVHHHPFLRASKAKIVVDLYDPTMLENLERFASLGADEQEAHHRVSMATYDELLRLGDFFVCASEKQRDFWLGALTQSDRVTPAAYAEDHTLRRLIDVVPFGVPNAPPRRTAPALKGVRPGIAATDKVILWGGGMWDWLDPLSAIDAMPTVLDRFPEARLVFLGTRHPNPDVPPSLMASRAIERAEALGLKDRGVFFNDWTPYDQRVNYLLDADIGISLHKDHIETRFSVRTRLMDYFWAGLPMVVSGGDTLSDVVRQKGLGKVIESSSAEEVAQAVIALLDAPVDRSRFPDVAAAFRWEVAATPLRDYVSAPWTSPKSHQAAGAGSSAMPGASLGSKAISSFQTRGLGGLLSDARQYLLWRMRRA